MLTSLDFLEVGRQWPPPEEAERHKSYRENRKLFESKADEVYGRWVRLLAGDRLEETHYVLSFHRRLSTLWADLVLGEPPDYSTTEGSEGDSGQDALDGLVEDNGVNATAHEVLVDASRYGDGLFRLRKEQGRVVIEGQSPEYWYPVVSPANVRKILYHVLAWTFNVEEATSVAERLAGESRTKTVTYLQAEVHEPGRVEHRLYRLGNSVIAERVADPASVLEDWPAGADGVEQTGLDVPLVFHAPGARTTDKLHGADDYAPIDSSMEYLMWLMAARQAVIHKHQDPSMAGPPMSTEQTSEGEVHASGSRYFAIDADSSMVPQYITWDGKLEPAFRQTEELWKDVYIESETSPAAFAHTESGFADSGTALRLRLVAPLKKAERIRQRFEPVMKAMLKAACEWSGSPLSELSINWKDGLPQDEREASQVSASDIQSGITSRKSEAMRRYGYDEEQAEAEVQAAAEEERAATPQPSVPELNLRGALNGASRNGRDEG